MQALPGSQWLSDLFGLCHFLNLCISQRHKPSSQDLFYSIIIWGSRFYSRRHRETCSNSTSIWETEDKGDLGVPYCVLWQKHSFSSCKDFVPPWRGIRSSHFVLWLHGFLSALYHWHLLFLFFFSCVWYLNKIKCCFQVCKYTIISYWWLVGQDSEK